MFDSKKTLIVVYKDEMLTNQLKKLIETNDDDEGSIVGTRDNSINIVSWTEKVWLSNKDAGNIQGKILFLGDVKGVDKLIPVLDVRFDEYGVKYGWAGNQAVLYADPGILAKRDDYDAFLKKLNELPIPDLLKISQSGTETELIEEKPIDGESSDSTDLNASTQQEVASEAPLSSIWGAITGAVSSGIDLISEVGKQVAFFSEEVFRDKTKMTQQMLFYGLIHLYNDDLERFMNS